MKKLELIELTETSVATVEANLATLDSHITEAARLESEFSAQAQAESDLLASDKSDDAKVKKLLEIRARRDVQAANLPKTNSAIAVVKEETIEAAVGASHWLNSLRDGLLLARKERVGAEVQARLAGHLRVRLRGRCLSDSCRRRFVRSDVHQRRADSCAAGAAAGRHA